MILANEAKIKKESQVNLSYYLYSLFHLSPRLNKWGLVQRTFKLCFEFAAEPFFKA